MKSRTKRRQEELSQLCRWENTSLRLLDQPGGEGWVRLAQIASFCSVGRMALRVLRHLWGDLAAPARNTGRDYSQALSVLEEQEIFLPEPNATISMPRLMRWAIKTATLQEWGDVEEQIGSSLARYPGMTRYDWSGFVWSKRILQHIPYKMWDGSLTVEILQRYPEFEAKCPWEMLDGGQWAKLLWIQPQFGDKCD